MRELISTLKKTVQAGNEWLNILPKSSHESKASKKPAKCVLQSGVCSDHALTWRPLLSQQEYMYIKFMSMDISADPQSGVFSDFMLSFTEM